MNPNLRILIDQAQAATPRNEREALVFTWLPLIDHIADRYGLNPLDDEQLSVALDALMRAAELFDPSRGCQFNTYAWRAIYYELTRPAPKKRIVTVPLMIQAGGRNHREECERIEASYTPDDPLEQAERRQGQRTLVRRLLRRMRPRDRKFVRAFVMQGKSGTQLAAQHGICKQRIDQLVQRGLDQARRGRISAEAVA